MLDKKAQGGAAYGTLKHRQRRKKVHSYLPPSNVLVAFGVVLVAPSSELCAIGLLK